VLANRLGLLAVALLLVASGCARAVAGQPSVAPKPAKGRPAAEPLPSATTVAESTATSAPKSDTTPAPSTTVLTRTPGTAVPAPSQPGAAAIAVADLVTFVPAELISRTTDTVRGVRLRLTSDRRSRQAGTQQSIAPIIVTEALNNGWIANLDVSPDSPELSARTTTLTLELFATAEGAAAYAAKEAPFWDPTPTLLQPVETPELPGSFTYRVVSDAGSAPLTQINVARGPVYLKVQVNDVDDRFTPDALNDALAVALEVVKRIDNRCGQSCAGDPASSAATPTPPAVSPTASGCLAEARSDIGDLRVPASELVDVPCSGVHFAEIVQRFPITLTEYPTSFEAVADAIAATEQLCQRSVIAIQTQLNDAATIGSVDTAILIPSPAEYDAGRRDATCVLVSFPDPFTARFLP
jgi:hypothetical protein